jgi:hypothetical protein
MCFHLCYRAVEEHKDLSCLWKLLGDGCTLVAQLPERYSHLYIKGWITHSSGCDEESEMLVLNKESMFQQGVR